MGQKAFAIGNPFGLDHTLTVGIVSGLGREIMGRAGRCSIDALHHDTTTQHDVVMLMAMCLRKQLTHQA